MQAGRRPVQGELSARAGSNLWRQAALGSSDEEDEESVRPLRSRAPGAAPLAQRLAAGRRPKAAHEGSPDSGSPASGVSQVRRPSQERGLLRAFSSPAPRSFPARRSCLRS
jgi:hypothetical protein